MTFHQFPSARMLQNQIFHNGLPEGWNRDRFRQLCVKYAQFSGCGAQCIRTLEIIIDLVSPNDFKDPTKNPLCYARQESLLGGRLITTKTIYNHERQLEKIGLIDRRLGANGSRCKRKQLGLFLSPALNLIPQMLDAQQQVDDLKQKHDRLRGDRSRLYRHVKATLTVLCALPRAAVEAQAHFETFRAWPRSDKLINMSFAALKAHVEDAEALLKVLEGIAKLQNNISGQPDIGFGCHIQDQIEDKILSCNATSEDEMASGKPSDSKFFVSGPTGPKNCSENEREAASVGDKPQLLPRITGRVLYSVSSPELKMHIDIAGG